LRWQLRHPDGSIRYLPVRCGAPNRCDYCAWLSSLETTLAVSLDTRLGDSPRVGVTLTTRDPNTPSATIRDASRLVTRAIRRRHPGCEYCYFVEWTTGRHARDGRRRLHMHGLVKHVPADQAPELEPVIREVWRRHTGAWRVECTELRTVPDAIGYFARHHAKPDQAPPAGWRGRRLRSSRGYFARPIAELRSDARELMRHDGLVAAVIREGELAEQPRAPRRRELEPVPPTGIAQAVGWARELAPRATLVRVRERPNGIIEPIGPM